MVVYTWWCCHIYKGDEVGVDVDQLSDETEARRVRNSTGRVSPVPYTKKIGSHRVDRTLVTW